MTNDILTTLNKFIETNSYLFSFLGFVIGIFGTIIGLYNWWKKRDIMRLRERVISAHFQEIRSFKKGIIDHADINKLRQHFSSLYNHFLEMISVILEPSDQELKTWLNKGYIDRDDYDFLIKLRLRK